MDFIEEMTEQELRRTVKESIDGEWIDATDRIENYENGKTMECDCGQGIGVEYGEMYVNCATCQTTLVDFKVGAREPPKKEQGQASLAQFT